MDWTSKARHQDENERLSWDHGTRSTQSNRNANTRKSVSGIAGSVMREASTVPKIKWTGVMYHPVTVTLHTVRNRHPGIAGPMTGTSTRTLFPEQVGASGDGVSGSNRRPRLTENRGDHVGSCEGMRRSISEQLVKVWSCRQRRGGP